ncbi:hypothetical protein ACF0DH_00690, partial [Acinetobacter baumannii]
MDKCREEFEKQRYWIGLFRTGVDFDVTLGEFGRYISNGTKSTDAMDLESFNEKCEENLERIKADTKNAAVKRDDFKDVLVRQHRITYNHAEEIIKSLGRAGRIRY